MTQLAAVLWDMDGTLVDTEPYWIEAEFALVEAHGGRWSHEHATRLIGSPLLVSAEYIREHGEVDLPPVQIVDRLLAHVVQRVQDAVPWQPGARELLAELSANGVPMALVTMSWTALADAVLSRLPSGTFAAVVTGDQVTHGKPHPEPYLLASARLGVEARRCVAIEDSPTGLASAEAAGVRTVGVPHLLALPPAARRVVVDSLTGIDAGWLARLVSEP